MSGTAALKGSAKTSMRDELINLHRERAFRMAKSRVRRWGAPLGDDEVRSLADLAVCEAAERFDPAQQVAFETYLFYFVRGMLSRAVRRGVRLAKHEFTADDEGAETSSRDQGVACESSSPERRYYLKELREHWRDALQVLSPLELDVILKVVIEGDKVAQVARELGYSRGHLSEVKRVATGKLRGSVELVLAAA